MAFDIKVISKNGLEFESEVDSVTLPAKDGYITVLKNHSSLITSLNTGTITARLSGSNEKIIEIDGGFSEIKNNKLIVLIN
jgi:F-type H+-transporting ATPase subunit epsilon